MGESEAARLNHTVVRIGDVRVVVALDGELDIATVQPLSAAVAAELTAETRLVIDVENLRFVDSSGIALWVAWSRAVARIEIRNAGPLVIRVVQTMGLTDVLNPS
jgi:anti-anti-sigma factor